MDLRNLNPPNDRESRHTIIHFRTAHGTAFGFGTYVSTFHHYLFYMLISHVIVVFTVRVPQLSRPRSGPTSLKTHDASSGRWRVFSIPVSQFIVVRIASESEGGAGRTHRSPHSARDGVSPRRRARVFFLRSVSTPTRSAHDMWTITISIPFHVYYVVSSTTLIRHRIIE